MGIEMLVPVVTERSRSTVISRPPAPARRRGRVVDCARYVVSGAAEWRRATSTLPVAELCRAALMGIYGTLYPQCDGSRGRSAVLAGKDQTGMPLSGHAHAFYLPTDEDGDGLLDHITVYAPGGFDAAHQAALGGLGFLRLPDAGEFLELQLASIGIGGEMGVGPLAKSEVWESATPYLATRFAKTRGGKRAGSRVEFLISDLSGQLQGFCQRRGGAAVVAIEPVLRDEVFCHPIPGGVAAGEYVRARGRRADDGGMRYCGYFRVRFAKAVSGPLALGHSAHYGMGMFLPGGAGGSSPGGMWSGGAVLRPDRRADLDEGQPPSQGE